MINCSEETDTFGYFSFLFCLFFSRSFSWTEIPPTVVMVTPPNRMDRRVQTWFACSFPGSFHVQTSCSYYFHLPLRALFTRLLLTTLNKFVLFLFSLYFLLPISIMKPTFQQVRLLSFVCLFSLLVNQFVAANDYSTGDFEMPNVPSREVMKCMGNTYNFISCLRLCRIYNRHVLIFITFLINFNIFENVQ